MKIKMNILIKVMPTLLIIASLVNIQIAYAQHNETNVSQDSYINPIYKDLDINLNTTSNSSSNKAKSFNEFDTIKDAANYMKKEMVHRNSNINFIVNIGYYNNIHQDIYKFAIDENNSTNSNEGDYLRAHMLGYNVNMTYTSEYVILSYNVNYLSTYSQEEEVNKKVKSLLNTLDVYNSNEYQKIKAIHDYIVNNIDYDYTFSKYSAYNAIVENDSVCQGFSSLTYKMLKELGIGVRFITGIGNGGAHSWNIVRINNLWYNIDNTWDENISFDNISYKYFLKNMNEFEDHTRDLEFSTNEFNKIYPMSKNSYIYNKSDIKGHWAEETINSFINQGYINGYNDGTFRPDNSISRAEFIKIFNKYFGLTNKSGKSFSDTKNHWAKDEIDIAVTNGIANGFEDNTFGPDEPITREQAAKIISNYKNLLDNNFDKINKYKDFNYISNWAKSSLEGVLEKGYMNGYLDNTFRPKNNITRAESVVLLNRIEK